MFVESGLLHSIRMLWLDAPYGVDYDLDFGLLARLSPEQPRRRWHRYQHFYLWFFYGFLLPKWVFFDDWVILKKRFIGVHPLPKPKP